MMHRCRHCRAGGGTREDVRYKYTAAQLFEKEFLAKGYCTSQWTGDAVAGINNTPVVSIAHGQLGGRGSTTRQW